MSDGGADGASDPVAYREPERTEMESGELHGTLAALPYRQIGPYRILRRIGAGGMGSVYEGVQPDIQRRVAIKLLHPELATRQDAQARLYREACAVNSVGHPGLVQISQVEQLPEGNLCLVMDFLRGETLASRLHQQGGKLPVGDAIYIALALADILSAAHQSNVVHRDLKPSNVMLVPDSQMPGGERVKLIDFGIAKIINAARPGDDKTPQDTVLGTPAYMSPEQCAGEAGIDGQSDVYALGALLFHLLAGRPPFVAATPRMVMAKHQLEQPVRLSQVCPHAPEELAALVGQLLAKAPAGRPRMESVLQTLRTLSYAVPVGGPLTPSAASQSTAPPPLHPAKTLADGTELPAARGLGFARWLLLSAVLILLGSATWMWWFRRPSRAQTQQGGPAVRAQAQRVQAVAPTLPAPALSQHPAAPAAPVPATKALAPLSPHRLPVQTHSTAPKAKRPRPATEEEKNDPYKHLPLY